MKIRQVTIIALAGLAGCFDFPPELLISDGAGADARADSALDLAVDSPPAEAVALSDTAEDAPHPDVPDGPQPDVPPTCQSSCTCGSACSCDGDVCVVDCSLASGSCWCFTNAVPCRLDCRGKDCKSTTLSCIDASCEVRCDKDATCGGKISCAPGLPCTVRCDGDQACKNEIDCNGACSCEVSCSNDACDDDKISCLHASCEGDPGCKTSGMLCDTCS